jgi:Transcription factor S-II (TFIIS), central domain
MDYGGIQVLLNCSLTCSSSIKKYNKKNCQRKQTMFPKTWTNDWAESLVGKDWEIFWDSTSMVDPTVDVNDIISPDGEINKDFMNKLNSDLPPLHPGEYDTVVFSTPFGLLMNIKAHDCFVTFNGYVPLPDGSKGPSESKNCIRGSCDVFIAINGMNVLGKDFTEVVSLLKEGAKSKYVALRLRICENGDDGVFDEITRSMKRYSSRELESADTNSKRHNDEENNESHSEDENLEDAIVDWYDGKVLMFQQTSKGCFFQVCFLGDSKMYTMVLNQNLVRPSARAWILRTKAILDVQDEENWEMLLPNDTSMLDDLDYLQSIQQQLEQNVVNMTPNLLHSTSKQDQNRIEKIQRLRFVTQSQIYLRTRLAPVEMIIEQQVDENEPSEVYIDHLNSCLRTLDEALEWFCKSWKLQQAIVNEIDLPSVVSPFVFHKEYIDAGRHTLRNLITITANRSVLKKRTAVSNPGARRTKRRKIQRDLEAMPSSIQRYSESESIDSVMDEFLTSPVTFAALSRFPDKIQPLLRKWFENFCLQMLSMMLNLILAPLEECEVEISNILGEESINNCNQDNSIQTIDLEHKDDHFSQEKENTKNQKYFTSQDIEDLLHHMNAHPVLRRIDLSSRKQNLHAKINSIAKLEADAWKVIATIADKPTNLCDVDGVLAALEGISDQLDSDYSFLIDESPLRNDADSKLTRKVIENAYILRKWLLDLHHAESHRERITFIQDVVDRANNLPTVPCLPGEYDQLNSLAARFLQAVASAQALSQRLISSEQSLDPCVAKLIQQPTLPADDARLQTLEGIDKILCCFSHFPFLSVVEEKLAVRKDLLLWVDSEKPFVNRAKKSRTLDDVEETFKILTNILIGTSQGRKDLIVSLKHDGSMEKEIRHGAQMDFEHLTDNIGPKFHAQYVEATNWKQRALTMLNTLRFHRNPVAGEPLTTSKGSSMVELKRIQDLLDDYETLNFSIPEFHKVILAVWKDATQWSQDVHHVIDTEQNLLSQLIFYRNERPRGIIVDPARHIFDAFIELLDWHRKVKESIGTNRQEIDFTIVHGLIYDGSEIIDRYISWRKSGDDEVDYNIEALKRYLSNAYKMVRQPKLNFLSKIDASPLGQMILDKLYSPSFDAIEGFPFLMMLHLVWIGQISDVVHAATHEASAIQPTLREAETLLRLEPKLSNGGINALLNEYMEKIKFQFLCLIDEGKALEANSKQMLCLDKEIFRERNTNGDQLREILGVLKTNQLKFKALKQGGKGLVLDSDLEKNLDRLIKEICWFLRALSHPILFSTSQDEETSERVPFSEIVALYDRIPQKHDGRMWEISRVIIRVKTLYEAADIWQKTVSSLFSLSNRGAKRRQVLSQDSDVDATENQVKVSNFQLSDLIKDPILLSVSIPNEGAVRDVLNYIHQLDGLLRAFLSLDFDGDLPDRAPFPEGSSFIGVNGEFHLFRFTGSPLYTELLSVMANIRQIVSNITAETAGKDLFEWIEECVKWIELLTNAVTLTSPLGSKDRLVIPIEDAVRILNKGRDIFLDIRENVKRGLALQKICISANKQLEKMTISSTKGGALHSVGGTTLKWCALLFEWLKFDIEKYHVWLTRATHLLEKAREWLDNFDNPSDISQDIINDAYCCAEDLEFHRDALESLVIVPEKAFVDSLNTFPDVLKERLTTLVSESKCKLQMDVAKISRYRDTSILVTERHNLLNALLTRHRLTVSDVIDDHLLSDSMTDYREKARMKLESKVMKKGMRMIGLETNSQQDASLYCALRSWEIESAVFSAMNEDDKSFVNQYMAKLTSYFNNIDAVKNPTLCARVIANKITAHDLVKMSFEESVNAEMSIKKSIETVESEKKDSKSQNEARAKASEPRKNTMKTLLKMTLSSRDLSSTSKPNEPTPTLSSPVNPIPHIESTLEQSRETTVKAILNGSSPAVMDMKASETTTERIDPLTVPPPPPPLILSTNWLSNPLKVAYSFVLSESGTDKFTFKIAGDERRSANYTFQTKLILEDAKSSDLNGILKELILSKGRLQMNDFNSFLGSKLKSGRSKMTVLRLSVCGGSDMFKKFYKEYQSKDRIAFCDLENGHKVFLLTPKYHHAAAPSIRERLVHEKSTYAVLLCKKRKDLEE